MTKLSQITAIAPSTGAIFPVVAISGNVAAAPAPAALALSITSDQVVGVKAGAIDALYSLTQLSALLGGGGGGGTPGGANTNVQFNNAGVFGGDSGFTYAGSGQATLALGTITTNLKALNITGTYNAAGVTFDAPIFANITTTAQAANSSILDLQAGGTTVFGVFNTDTGAWNANHVYLKVFGQTFLGSSFNGDFIVGSSPPVSSSANLYVQNGVGTSVPSAAYLGWASSSNAAGTIDTKLYRQGTAGIIAQVNGANAQGFQVYNTSDTNGGTPTNYERGVLDFITTSNVLTIGTQAGGTGTLRGINFVGSNFNFGGYLNWNGQARVTSDFSVTSSAVLVNVTGLSVNVAAGRTYSFTAYLTCTCAAAGGVKAAIAGTATATNIIYDGYTLDSNTTKGQANATALAATVGSTTTTATTGVVIEIAGIITVNAAGTLTVQFAQNTSNGTASIVKRGSYLIVHDMP